MKTRGIILAAGRGSRLGTLTLDRPKCLVQVRGKVLLDWQSEALRAVGVDQIAVVTGYRRESVEAAGLIEFHNSRWSETNMVSSLECAKAWLEAGPCVVSYSDIFYTSGAVESLCRCPSPLAITYDPHWRALWERRFGDPLCDAETFRLQRDGSLADIGGKPISADEVQGQYMGLLRFEPRGWHEVARIRESLSPNERDRMDMTGTLRRVIAARRLAITAIPYCGEWGEIDTLHDLSLYGTNGKSGL